MAQVTGRQRLERGVVNRRLQAPEYEQRYDMCAPAHVHRALVLRTSDSDMHTRLERRSMLSAVAAEYKSVGTCTPALLKNCVIPFTQPCACLP